MSDNVFVSTHLDMIATLFQAISDLYSVMRLQEFGVFTDHKSPYYICTVLLFGGVTSREGNCNVT